MAAALLVAAAALQLASQTDLPASARAAARNWFGQKPDPIEGRASVIDGDTIEIHGQRIRFNGIDAPESRQYCEDAKGFDYLCGSDSATALDEFLAASRPVRCTFVSWDQYGRFVGDCRRADGRNVQSWLVENGYAMDWPRYSGGAYGDEQERARQRQKGIWQGRFEPPWDWRVAHRTPSSTTAGFGLLSTGSGACNIKGNISSSGERIYHVPGQKYYAVTRISPGKGERWFCSEVEAQAAGWRKSRQ